MNSEGPDLAAGPTTGRDHRPAKSSRRFAALASCTLIVTLVIARLSAPPDGPTAPRNTGDRTDAGSAVVDRRSPVRQPDIDPQWRFVDVTDLAGLNQPQSSRVPYAGDAAPIAGAAVADLDSDGWDDVFLTRDGLPDRLLMNNRDGTFLDVAPRAGILAQEPGAISTSGVFADVDADGDLDLFVTRLGGASSLFVNNGDLTFTDSTVASGLGLYAENLTFSGLLSGATFADFDVDGDLDLLVLEWQTWYNAALSKREVEGNDECREARSRFAANTASSPVGRSRLFTNDGNGRFTDVTSDVGLNLDPVAAMSAQFVDLDTDGWDDLLLTGDFCTSRLYRNVNGQRFDDITDRAGVGTDENGMGSAVRDLDGDERLDWIITSIADDGADGQCPSPPNHGGCSGNRVYLNQGGSRFSDATDRFAIRDGYWGWGIAIEDFDNDGVLEIAQANGSKHTFPSWFSATPEALDMFRSFHRDPLRFWVRRDDTYIDAAEQLGLGDDRIGNALVPFDFDRDGDLDLLVANVWYQPRLFRNDSPPQNAWITVALEDPSEPGNRQAVGAVVRFVHESGDSDVVVPILTSGSYASQKPAEAHLGMGVRVPRLARIEITWPGGGRPQLVPDPPLNQRLVVQRSRP